MENDIILCSSILINMNSKVNNIHTIQISLKRDNTISITNKPENSESLIFPFAYPNCDSEKLSYRTTFQYNNCIYTSNRFSAEIKLFLFPKLDNCLAFLYPKLKAINYFEH